MQGSETQRKSDTLKSPLGAVLVAFWTGLLPVPPCPLPPPSVHSCLLSPLPAPHVHSHLLVSIPSSSCPLPPPGVHSQLPRALSCPVSPKSCSALGALRCICGFLVRREGRGIGHFSSSCLCQVSHPVCVCCSCAQNLGMLFWHGCQTWILLSCADAVNFLETLGRG